MTDYYYYYYYTSPYYYSYYYTYYDYCYYYPNEDYCNQTGVDGSECEFQINMSLLDFDKVGTPSQQQPQVTT